MNDAATKTGGVLYFEPLRTELHDCFGAIKNVQPDSVFSSHQGMIVHTPPDDAAESSNDLESNEPDNASKDNEQQKGPRECKSMFLLHVTINNYQQLNSVYVIYTTQFWHI